MHLYCKFTVFLYYSFVFKTTEAKELRNKVQLNNKNGPCVERLEKELQKIGVHPQAYHGGDFIGNHVNICLKVCVLIKSYKCKV